MYFFLRLLRGLEGKQALSGAADGRLCQKCSAPGLAQDQEGRRGLVRSHHLIKQQRCACRGMASSLAGTLLHTRKDEVLALPSRGLEADLSIDYSTESGMLGEAPPRRQKMRSGLPWI